MRLVGKCLGNQRVTHLSVKIQTIRWVRVKMIDIGVLVRIVLVSQYVIPPIGGDDALCRHAGAGKGHHVNGFFNQPMQCPLGGVLRNTAPPLAGSLESHNPIHQRFRHSDNLLEIIAVA